MFRFCVISPSATARHKTALLVTLFLLGACFKSFAALVSRDERGLRLNTQLVEQEKKGSATQELIARLQDELAKVEQDSAEKNTRIAEISRTLATLGPALEQQMKRRQDAETHLAAAGARLAQRLAAYHAGGGPPGMARVILGSDSLSDLILMELAHEKILNADKAINDDWRRKSAIFIKEERESLALRSKNEAALAALHQKETELLSLSQRKKELLARQQAARELYAVAADELRSSMGRMGAAVVAPAATPPTVAAPPAPPTAPRPPAPSPPVKSRAPVNIQPIVVLPHVTLLEKLP